MTTVYKEKLITYDNVIALLLGAVLGGAMFFTIYLGALNDWF